MLLKQLRDPCVKTGNAQKSTLKQSRRTHQFLETTPEREITHTLSTPSQRESPRNVKVLSRLPWLLSLSHGPQSTCLNSTFTKQNFFAPEKSMHSQCITNSSNTRGFPASLNQKGHQSQVSHLKEHKKHYQCNFNSLQLQRPGQQHPHSFNDDHAWLVLISPKREEKWMHWTIPHSQFHGHKLGLDQHLRKRAHLSVWTSQQVYGWIVE